MFDCGEGTQRQLMRSVGLGELEEIFLTHFHADHVLGLPGMLKTYALRQREEDLLIHGPLGLKRLYEFLSPVIGRLPFMVRLIELEPNEELLRNGYRIAAFAVHHTRSSLGYALVENPRPGVFDPAQARALGIADGPDFGRLQRGEEVSGVRPDQVMGETRRGRKIVLTGDTAPCDMTRLVAWEADVLVHEATFLEEDSARAAETRHSTAAQAVEIGLEAGARMVALTHISPRYGIPQVRDEVAQVLDRMHSVDAPVIFPRDFDRVEVPFPERGEPVHIQAPDRPPRPDAVSLS